MRLATLTAAALAVGVLAFSPGPMAAQQGAPSEKPSESHSLASAGDALPAAQPAVDASLMPHAAAEDAQVPEAPNPQAPAAKPEHPCAPQSDTDMVQPHTGSEPVPCPKPSPIAKIAFYLTGPLPQPITPRQKARLAARSLLDPFNALEIVADGAIYVGANARSDYGPGMDGFGKYVGVSYTEDLTGEFFGTFLIPSILHQDPRYHRVGFGHPIAARVAHTAIQVLWTRGDDGRRIPNYANILGFAIDDEIDNLYVPDRRTDLESSAQRYAVGLALAPTGNLITEFLPDIAAHIHLRSVFIQRIIDRVVGTPAGNQ